MSLWMITLRLMRDMIQKYHMKEPPYITKQTYTV